MSHYAAQALRFLSSSASHSPRSLGAGRPQLQWWLCVCGKSEKGGRKSTKSGQLPLCNPTGGLPRGATEYTEMLLLSTVTITYMLITHKIPLIILLSLQFRMESQGAREPFEPVFRIRESTRRAILCLEDRTLLGCRVGSGQNDRGVGLRHVRYRHRSGTEWRWWGRR